MTMMITEAAARVHDAAVAFRDDAAYALRWTRAARSYVRAHAAAGRVRGGRDWPLDEPVVARLRITIAHQ